MKVHRCKQGTPEWLQLRAGRPTASNADQILTAGGRPSKSQERYLFTLLAERCLGEPLEQHMSFWMQRGSQLEKEALDYYRFQRDCETEAIGFITTDDEQIGASPDQLVGNDGLLEIKCPQAWQHMSWLVGNGSAHEVYKVQTQCQLYVTERQWVDVLSYYPGLPEALVRVERDEVFIKALAAEMKTFCLELERQTQILANRGMVQTVRVSAYSEQDELIQVLKDSLREMKGGTHDVQTLDS